ncbi:MAG: hypothetical protein RL531_1853 [Actinomycetota bacterium]|jgi:hypothetical protein
MDEAFWEITEDLRRSETDERYAEALAIYAAGVGARPFREQLRRVPVGESVSIVTRDGAWITGRVIAVGLDWLRIAESYDDEGAARARVRRHHDVRVDAVVRLVREVR